MEVELHALRIAEVGLNGFNQCRGLFLAEIELESVPALAVFSTNHRAKLGHRVFRLIVHEKAPPLSRFRDEL
jgi:hypothetical protein